MGSADKAESFIIGLIILIVERSERQNGSGYVRRNIEMDRFEIDRHYPCDYQRSTPHQVCILEVVGYSDRADRQMLICDEDDAEAICSAMNSGYKG